MLTVSLETINDLRSNKALENTASLGHSSPSLVPSSGQRSSSPSGLTGLVRSSSSPVNQTDDGFPLHAITRSGTCIAHEEQSVDLQQRGSTRSLPPLAIQDRHPTQPTIQPQGLQEATIASNPCLFVDGTFYLYTWFRDLLILLLILVSEVIIHILIQSYSNSGSVVGDISNLFQFIYLITPFWLCLVVFWCVHFEGDMLPNHQTARENSRFRKTKVPVSVIIWLPRILGVGVCLYLAIPSGL